MPRFFVYKNDIAENRGSTVITVSGADAMHISKVLRMKVGEQLTVCDSDGVEYDTVIEEIGDRVLVRVLSSKKSENEPPYLATVYQSLVRGERFDTVLQKSTELGAARIVPVITSRCTVKLDKKEYGKKLERWQRIVHEAAKQCGRASIPRVEYPMEFESAVNEASSADISLFCYEGEGTRPIPLVIETAASPKSVAIMVGPEGGYSDEEADFANKKGMNMTGLGRRILRTETAAPFVLSCLSYKFELCDSSRKPSNSVISGKGSASILRSIQ